MRGRIDPRPRRAGTASGLETGRRHAVGTVHPGRWDRAALARPVAGPGGNAWTRRGLGQGPRQCDWCGGRERNAARPRRAWCARMMPRGHCIGGL
jgi:hypothetical protein